MTGDGDPLFTDLHAPVGVRDEQTRPHYRELLSDRRRSATDQTNARWCVIVSSFTPVTPPGSLDGPHSPSSMHVGARNRARRPPLGSPARVSAVFFDCGGQ